MFWTGRSQGNFMALDGYCGYSLPDSELQSRFALAGEFAL
jgi:hypothetical protein